MNESFFGEYDPQTPLHVVFLTWAYSLSDMIALASERHELSLEFARIIREATTEEVFKGFNDLLQKEGFPDKDTFYEEFLLPMEQVFLQQNDSLIAQGDEHSGLGPAGAFRHFQNLIFSQIDHIPDTDLQEMFDALKAGGGLIAASTSYRDHIDAIAGRLIRTKLVQGVDQSDLSEHLYDAAREAAMEDTGPARRKKRGPKAGQPKRMEDAFGFNLARENAREWTKQKSRVDVDGISTDSIWDGERRALDEEAIHLLLHRAQQCCTDLEQKYLQLRYVDNLSIGDIAKQRGIRKSTVQRSIDHAKKKIKCKL